MEYQEFTPPPTQEEDGGSQGHGAEALRDLINFAVDKGLRLIGLRRDKKKIRTTTYDMDQRQNVIDSDIIAEDLFLYEEVHVVGGTPPERRRRKEMLKKIVKKRRR